MSRNIWYSLLILCLSLRLGAQAPVLPLETPEFRGDWQGAGTFQHVVDEKTGRLALDYTETLDSSGTEIVLDFDWQDLRRYDLLTFDWRSTGDEMLAQVALEGYPDGLRRNYYLFKNPSTPGTWQHVWLDLGLDDDGVYLPKVELPEGKLRLRFLLRLNPVAIPSATPRIGLRLSDVKLVDLPVELTSDMRTVRDLDEGGRIGQLYTLLLTNESETPRQTTLHVDTANLVHFQVSLAEDALTLAPGESRSVEARITMDAEQATRLTPLYLEEAAVFARVVGEPDWTTPWNGGYMLNRLRGAVPLPDREAPVLLPREEAEAGRRRLAGEADSTAEARLLQQADALLTLDPTPPTLLHGNPNHYFCPVHNSVIRFRGPGKDWCERGDHIVDLTTVPEKVQRASAYAHHGYLAKAAHTLADAGWKSGDRKYMNKASEILLTIARLYPTYPVSEPSATGFQSRIGWGVLQESWWFDPIPHAYDLVRAAGIWSEDEEELVRRDLVLEGVMAMRVHRSVANQQAEYNRSVGIGSLAIRHHVLAAEALDGEYGMRAQWRLDFDADGWTMERDLGYHRAAAKPFLDFALALDANGVPVFDERLKKLFDAPVLRSRDLIGMPFLEGLEKYGDPLYARTLAAARRQPLPPMPEGFPNSVLPEGGFTVLRAGTSDANLVTATINWGEPSHRGGRVLLNPHFTWHGHELNTMVARIGYGYEQSGFSYTTAAGNSIVIDGQVHSMLRADQVAVLDGDYPAGRWLAPFTRPPAQGVQWARTLALCGDTAVVLDQVEAKRPVRLDWLTYLSGELQAADGETTAWRPIPDFSEQGSGYQYFLSPEMADGDAPRRFPYVLGAKAAAHGELSLLYPEGTKVVRMRAPTGWHPREVPVLAMRQEAVQNTWFAAAYTGSEAAAEAGATLQRLNVSRDGQPLTPTEALAIRVTTPGGSYLILSTSREGDVDVEGRLMRGPLSVIAD